MMEKHSAKFYVGQKDDKHGNQSDDAIAWEATKSQ